MSDRKIRSDCMRMAPCGRTSKSRCLRNMELPECAGCTLISRMYSRWRMVDRKPMIVCSRCGRTLPVEDFYRKTVRRGDKVYETYEYMCRKCRSEWRYEKLARARASPA